jgi:hypothetical protein
VLLQQVSHGAIQFTAYEELRKVIVDLKSKGSKKDSESDDKLLVSLYNQCPSYILVHRNCINVHILEVPPITLLKVLEHEDFLLFEFFKFTKTHIGKKCSFLDGYHNCNHQL